MAVIFIVDDDQAIGEMLSLVLENEGFQTVTCMDGLRAVEMFPTVKPDLILLDVMLPGLDGTQVARRIRQTSNVPIIMLTAKSDTTDVVAGRKPVPTITCPSHSRSPNCWRASAPVSASRLLPQERRKGAPVPMPPM
nr:response regulator [Bifidobacterium colobi]